MTRTIIRFICLYIHINLSEINMSNYEAPLDFVRKSIGEKVLIRLRNKVNIRGELVAYDDHLNMMIKDASLKRESNTEEKHLIYLRGDMILLVGKD